MEEEQSQSPVGLKDHKLEGCMVPMEVDPSTHDINKKFASSDGRGLVASEGDEILEPCEGMEFDSEEAARTFYSAYASRMGFCTRIRKYSRSRHDNSVISRRFVCSKEGFREVRVKKGVRGEHRLQQHAVTRVGCKAMIMVKKLGSGKWVVTRFTKEHNHGPVLPEKVELMVTCEANDSIVKSSVSEEGMVREPFEGMVFESEEAVRTFYTVYAMHMGFCARVSKYCRSRRDNSIISRQIVCSKEGFQEVRTTKDSVNEGKVRRPRVITRIGCKAMIAVKKLTSGTWVVTRFVKEHNHALGTSKNFVHLQSDTSPRKYLALPEASAMCTGVAIGGCSEMQSVPQDTLPVLYNQLCYEALRYAQDGAVSDEIYNVAMTALKEAVEKVTAAKRSAITATQTSHHKVDNVKLDPAKSISEVNRSKTSHPGLSDAEVVAIPALPVAPCRPAKGSVTATCSVTESIPLKSPCTLVTTPIGADAITQSIDTRKPESAIHAGAPSLATLSGSLSGFSRNSQVHATALAAGARILPPKAAASLIKAVESRIRSPDALLTISVHTDNNAKQLTFPH